jgi:hypothetical protein
MGTLWRLSFKAMPERRRACSQRQHRRKSIGAVVYTSVWLSAEGLLQEEILQLFSHLRSGSMLSCWRRMSAKYARARAPASWSSTEVLRPLPATASSTDGWDKFLLRFELTLTALRRALARRMTLAK